jgi:hypothetical protein
MLSPSSGYMSKCGENGTFKGRLEHGVLSFGARTVKVLWPP